MPKKFSTILAIAGAICYTLALYFMYRETCRYYEETYELTTPDEETVKKPKTTKVENDEAGETTSEQAE